MWVELSVCLCYNFDRTRETTKGGEMLSKKLVVSEKDGECHVTRTVGDTVYLEMTEKILFVCEEDDPSVALNMAREEARRRGLMVSNL